MHVGLGQDGSAVREFTAASVGHDDHVEVEMTVGATPPGYGMKDSPATVHCCSSRVTLLKRLKRGDGRMIPDHGGYKARIDGELPAITRPCIIRFQAKAHPNGALTITPLEKRCAAVLVPAKLIPYAPWAFEGGSEQVAEELGCSTLDEMFEKHGQELVLT